MEMGLVMSYLTKQSPSHVCILYFKHFCRMSIWDGLLVCWNFRMFKFSGVLQGR